VADTRSVDNPLNGRVNPAVKVFTPFAGLEREQLGSFAIRTSL